MPRGDRRGPEGRGSMTGRGLGYCAGNDRPGFAAGVPQGAGRGLRNGGGFGPGFGRGRRFNRACVSRGYGFNRGLGYAPVSQSENLDSSGDRSRETARLENLANSLANELEIVKNQLEDLKNND